MDALALYSLKQLPKEKTVVKKRPSKRVKLQEQTANTIQYRCQYCGGSVYLSSEDIVQCNSCDNRIVEKVSTKVVKTYNAV